jgi:hypothetical protein
MAGGPITRLILRMRRSDSSRKTVTAGAPGELGRSLDRSSEALRRVVLDEATLDRLAAEAAAAPEPGAARRGR